VTSYRDDQERKIAEKWKKYELKPEDFLHCTPENEKTAMEKFADAAKRIDKSSALGANILAAFQGAFLVPQVFKEVCRRCLDVKLTTPELAAVTIRYDKTGDRSEINCSKFMMDFAQMSFNENEKLRDRQRQQAMTETKRKAEEEKKLMELQKIRDNRAADFHFTEEDKESALAKLKFAAPRYDKSSSPAANAIYNQLQTTSMKLQLLRELLKKGMSIDFTAREFGAAIAPYCNGEGSKVVNAYEFMKAFTQLQNDYREEQRQRRIEAERAVHQLRRDGELQREEEKKKKDDAKLKHRDEDENTLMAKLRKVAQIVAIDRYVGS
jgi:hypothetical protein